MSYEAIYDGVRYPLADAAAAHGLEEAVRGIFDGNGNGGFVGFVSQKLDGALADHAGDSDRDSGQRRAEPDRRPPLVTPPAADTSVGRDGVSVSRRRRCPRDFRQRSTVNTRRYGA
ncbi:hypothetical protein [Rhodococcus sp. LB1]|uniref:hypothetical protein n=1 Tax=Rhodococcus sp. LB1 TaxID=1807499 RepID=UPI001E2FA595|nr:hypothetical protein [Rhodococcus sp. LB1]